MLLLLVVSSGRKADGVGVVLAGQARVAPRHVDVGARRAGTVHSVPRALHLQVLVFLEKALRIVAPLERGRVMMGT